MKTWKASCMAGDIYGFEARREDEDRYKSDEKNHISEAAKRRERE